MELTTQEHERLAELENKNSHGLEPRLTEQELNELQYLLDKFYDQEER